MVRISLCIVNVFYPAVQILAEGTLHLTVHAATAHLHGDDAKAAGKRIAFRWEKRPLVSAEMLWDTVELVQTLYFIFLSDIVSLLWAIAWRLAYPALAIFRRFLALFCFILGASQEELGYFLADVAHQTVAALQVFAVYADQKLVPLTNWAIDWLEESLGVVFWLVVRAGALAQHHRFCIVRLFTYALLNLEEVPYAEPPWLDPGASSRIPVSEAILGFSFKPLVGASWNFLDMTVDAHWAEDGEKALKLADAIRPPPAEMGDALHLLGACHLRMRSFATAIKCFERAMLVKQMASTSEGHGDQTVTVASSLLALGSAHLQSGSAVTAARCLQTVVATLEELGDEADELML
ncbi:unnamed protein product, partial [Symbiodinium pilosum]